jgi:hypothetical protein
MDEIILRAKSELLAVHSHIKESNDLEKAMGSAKRATNYFSQIKSRKLMTNGQMLSGLLQSGMAKREKFSDNGKVKEAFELNAQMLAELDKLLKENK